jgi:hypothetical protein
MALKKPPQKPKSSLDGIGSVPQERKNWAALFGKPALTIDKINTVQKRGYKSEMSVATLASASMARDKQQSTTRAGGDFWGAFRGRGDWDAKAILADFVAPDQDQFGRPKRIRGKAISPGLLSAGQAIVAAAIWGGVKGVRDLANAIVAMNDVDMDCRREAESIARAVGSRKLDPEQLRRLPTLLCTLAGHEDEALLDRVGRLVDFRTAKRVIGVQAEHSCSPRQVLDIRSQDAALIVVDMPQKRKAVGRRGPEFKRVVVLLREVNGELTLLDPQGIHDPTKGSDDTATLFVCMRKPDEMRLRNYLQGRADQAPMTALSRLSWNGYLSAAMPEILANIEIIVPSGCCFRFC